MTALRPAGWPPLPRTPAWSASQGYVHLVTQMMGKLRLALSPSQPEWFHTSLALGARGLTTGALPCGDRSVEATLDVLDAVLSVHGSEGSSRRIPLMPGRPVAEIWAEYTGALLDIGVRAEMRDRPQELADATPFSEDHRKRSYDPGSVASWFAATTAVRNVFDEWRSPFFGRTGINFWWGAFDLTALVFSGRHATPRAGAGPIKRFDLDAELVALGFWPGNQDNDAMCYGYLVPEPEGCARHPLKPPTARWDASKGEWVLPYEAIRAAPDPAAALSGFMDSVYAAAGELAGWDLAAYRYDRPPRHAIRP